MAWEEVQESNEEKIGKYWNPTQIGEKVEGNIYDFVDDDYGNKRIELCIGQDEYGEAITTILPAHAHLRKFYKNIAEGDYILVELKEVIPPREGQQYPTKKYKLMKDPERGVDWE